MRRYASEGGASSGGSNTAIYAAVAAAAGAGGYYYYSQTGRSKAPAAAEGGAPASTSEQHTVPASTPKSAAFTGGDQGFISLKLDSVEEINHNTKKFRFALPNPEDVSGLQIACTFISVSQQETFDAWLGFVPFLTKIISGTPYQVQGS